MNPKPTKIEFVLPTYQAENFLPNLVEKAQNDNPVMKSNTQAAQNTD